MLYREYLEENHMLGGWLDNATYSEAIKSFVIVCTDIIILGQQKGLIYLAKRVIKPMPGWWFVGGRAKAGESFLKSAQMHFLVDVGLELPEYRFARLAMHRYVWSERQQEPQDVGSDNLCYVYMATLSDDELSRACLSSNEYDSELGLCEFDRNRLITDGVHAAVIDIYDHLFS